MVDEEGRLKCLRSLRTGALTSVQSAAARGAILAFLGVAFCTRGCDGPDRPRRSGSRDLVHRPDGGLRL